MAGGIRGPGVWAAAVAAWLALGATPSAPAQEPAPWVPSDQLATLDTVAKAVAGTGRLALALTIVDGCRQLGRPDVAALEREVHSTAARADLRPGPQPKLAADVRAAAETLAGGLADLPADRAAVVAGFCLRLDGNCAAARAHLGHERSPTGGWRTPAEAAMDARRVQLCDWVARARDLPFELRADDSSHAMLAPVGGGFGARLQFGPFILHTDFQKPQAERIVREALRARAVANALRTGQFFPPIMEARFELIMVTTEPAWTEAVRQSTAAGALRNDPGGNQYYWDTRGFGVRFVRETAFASNSVLRLLSPLAGQDPPVSAYALTGHLDWVACTYLAASLGVFTSTHSTTDVTDQGLPAAFAKHRAAARKLQGAGVAGQAAWLAHLMETGEAPPIERFTVHDLGRLVGDVRGRLVTAFAWLHERGPVEPVLTRLVGEQGLSPDGFAAAVGAPLPAVDQAIAHWMLDGRAGVADLLEPPGDGASDRNADKLLRHLRVQRAAAHKREVPAAIADSADIDPRLSAGCQLHAAFCVRHADRVGAAALHEPPDLPGATGAGAWAAIHSCVARGERKPEAVVDDWLATLEGRAALLAPGLTRVGVAIDGDVTVVDARSMVREGLEHWTYTWPVEGARNVPRTYGTHGVPAVDGTANANLGYPVSIQRSPWRGGQVVTKMTLYEAKSGEEVACHVVRATDAHWSSRLPPQTYALIPKESLKARTDYDVAAETTSMGTHRWSFKTGAR